MPEVVEWHLERGGGLQIYELPERAGQGSCTLIVDDIDGIARDLDVAGLAAGAWAMRTDRVDTIMIKDPDGNSIAFRQAEGSGAGPLSITEPECGDCHTSGSGLS